MLGAAGANQEDPQPGQDTTRVILDWGSKRQSVVAKSSTEAEVIALNESLVRSTYPLTGVLDEIWGHIFPWVHHVDNDAARLAALRAARLRFAPPCASSPPPPRPPRARDAPPPAPPARPRPRPPPGAAPPPRHGEGHLRPGAWA